MENLIRDNPSHSCTWSMPTRPLASSDTWRISEVQRLEEPGELYLSVVMAVRHDDSAFCQHPPDACLDRTRNALSLLLHLLAERGLAHASELILVEWNPCHSRAAAPCSPRRGGYSRLVELVRSSVAAPAAVVDVRILEVPEAVHARTYNPYAYDHFELHAKNAGARRARGRFVVFSNPDNLWTEALVDRLAGRSLRDDTFYAADRPDVIVQPPLPSGLGGASAPVPAALQNFFERHSVHPHAGPEPYGFPRAACVAGTDDEPWRYGESGWRSSDFHTYAPGDFLLVPRRGLAVARGLPEIPTNTHVDSLAVLALAAHGFGQLVFTGACSIYHQPHVRNEATKRLAVSEDEMFRLLDAMLDSGSDANRRPPWAEESTARPAGAAKLEEELPWERWNAEDWGLASVDLRETLLQSSCVL